MVHFQYLGIIIKLRSHPAFHLCFPVSVTNFLFFSVGVFKNGRVEIIANDQGNRITPSYVAFTEEGNRLIGDAAKNQLTTNPTKTIFDAKRMIGRTWEDSSLQKDLKFFPFKTVNLDNKPHISVDVKGEHKNFAPEEISAMVLAKVKFQLYILFFHIFLLKFNL